CAPRDVENAPRIEVTLARQRPAEAVGLVAAFDERRAGVDVGMHGDRADAHRPRRARDAHGDLAAVGDQEPPDRARGLRRRHCAATTAACAPTMHQMTNSTTIEATNMAKRCITRLYVQWMRLCRTRSAT